MLHDSALHKFTIYVSIGIITFVYYVLGLRFLVISRCENMPSCTIEAAVAWFGDICVETSKYLEVTYECQPGRW